VSDRSGYSYMNDNYAPATWGLPIQMSEQEHEWVIRADLPEVDLAEINLLVSNRAFTIIAPSKCTLGTSDTGYFRVERQLPVGVFTDDIRARYSEGVLEISLPKSEQLFRRVPIEP
jgi:HSP20 family protein